MRTIKWLLAFLMLLRVGAVQAALISGNRYNHNYVFKNGGPKHLGSLELVDPVTHITLRGTSSRGWSVSDPESPFNGTEHESVEFFVMNGERKLYRETQIHVQKLGLPDRSTRMKISFTPIAAEADVEEDDDDPAEAWKKTDQPETFNQRTVLTKMPAWEINFEGKIVVATRLKKQCETLLTKFIPSWLRSKEQEAFWQEQGTMTIDGEKYEYTRDLDIMEQVREIDR